MIVYYTQRVNKQTLQKKDGVKESETTRRR